MASSIIYQEILEFVLLCTVNKDSSAISTSAIYLTDLASSNPKKWDKNQIDRALIERLQMSDPSNHLIVSPTEKSSITCDIVTENRCLHYLSAGYLRLLQRQVNFYLSFRLN